MTRHLPGSFAARNLLHQHYKCLLDDLTLMMSLSCESRGLVGCDTASAGKFLVTSTNLVMFVSIDDLLCIMEANFGIYFNIYRDLLISLM